MRDCQNTGVAFDVEENAYKVRRVAAPDRSP